MMKFHTLQNIDIYLLDQIFKDRFKQSDVILDAGCGNGRNLAWFIENNYTVFGIDADASKIDELQKKYPQQSANFSVATLENLSFNTNTFHHIICNAVLHFAESETQFNKMFTELYRVLKPNGMLFIRMTSDIGIENRVQHIKNGVYQIPDGSKRFLLTQKLLQQLQTKHHFTFLEPLKTVNVNDIRCMTTLVLIKK